MPGGYQIDFSAGEVNLECGDLSPLSFDSEGCDKSQPTKALTSQRTPNLEQTRLR
jgi:hypothetical protein